MMNIVDWKAERAGKFTASEICKLLVSGRKKDEVFGETALSYINKKAVECLVPIDKIPSIDNTPSIRWGNEYEQVANTEYSLRKMFDGQVEYFGKENPKFFPLKGHEHYAGGSPDAIQGDWLIEYKCPYNPETHLENLLMQPDELPVKRKEYYAQMQFNMMCTGLNKAHFVSYDPRFSDPAKRLSIVEVAYNEDFCNNLMERLCLAEEYLISILSKL